jgi:signal transduction histidine kinase
VRIHLQLRQLTQTLDQQVQSRTAQLHQALEDLKQSQIQLVQNEKMSALGNLVAGVAHEINNPIGYVIGNVDAVQDAIADLFTIIDLYQQKYPHPDSDLAETLAEIDLDYLREDLPKLVRSMKEGGDRIKSISKSLRIFSRSDAENKQSFDLHEGLDSTILILRHRLKANEQRPEIKVIQDYGSLPQINCFPGQLNQVFMNILANAIDALDESSAGKSYEALEADPNQIVIKTAMQTDSVQIAIADNGTGMPEAVKAQIFDHLFTTKPVGEGTGLGLAIAQQIITEKHSGAIAVTSQLGQGTEFIITLPLSD